MSNENSKLDAQRALFQAYLDDCREHDIEPSAASAFRFALQASSLPVGVPDGWKLVPVEPSFETRQALYNSGFEAPDNILDYAYRSVLGAVKIPVEEYRDDPRKPHELSAAGCRCVRFGEGNPHWPCDLHAAKKEQADLVAVWRCRIAGSESYAYFPSKRCRFCEPLYAAPTAKAEQVHAGAEWINPVALSSCGPVYDAGWRDGVAEAKRLNEKADMADAYVGAREDLAIWKRRALEAERKVRHQGQIIDYLALEAQGENRFGEPSLPAAGSAVEEVEVVGYRFFHVDHGYIFRRTHIYEGNPSLEAHSLMTVAQHERIVAALSAQQSASVTNEPSPLEVIGYASPGQIEILRELPRTGGMKVKGRKDDRYSEPLVLLGDARSAMLSLAVRCQQEGAFKTCLECGYQDGHDEICQFHASNRMGQQSAPERVGVLCEALEDARRAMFAVLNQEPRMKAVAKRVLNAEIDRIDRALLASHGRGEA